MDVYPADLWIVRDPNSAIPYAPRIGGRFHLVAKISWWWGDVRTGSGEYRIGNYPAQTCNPCRAAVDLLINGTWIGSKESSLKYWRSNYVAFGPFAASEGMITFEIIVNKDRSVPEERYDNNIFQRTYDFSESDLAFPSPFQFAQRRSLTFDSWAQHVISWPKGKFSYMALRNGSILRVSVDGARTILIEKTGGYGSAHLAVSSDGNYIVVGSNYRSVSLFSSNGSKLWTKSTLGYEHGVSIDANGDRIAVASGHVISVYDREGNILWYVSSQIGDIYGPAMSPDGAFVAFSTNKEHIYPYGEAYLALANQSGILWKFRTAGRSTNPVVTNGTKFVAFGSDDGSLYVFDRSGKLKVTSPAAGRLTLAYEGEPRLAHGYLSGEPFFIIASAGGLIRLVLLDGTVLEYGIYKNERDYMHVYSMASSYERGLVWVTADHTLSLLQVLSSDAAISVAVDLAQLAASANIEVSSAELSLDRARKLNADGLVREAYENAKSAYDDLNQRVSKYVENAILNLTLELQLREETLSNLPPETKMQGIELLNQTAAYLQQAQQAFAGRRLVHTMELIQTASELLVQFDKIESNTTVGPQPSTFETDGTLVVAIFVAAGVIGVLVIILIRSQRREHGNTTK